MGGDEPRLLTDGPLAEAARGVVARLVGEGHQALFAGGAVRDALLGIDPHDIDIATSARPDQVEAIFEKTVPVGRAFGVMIVVVDGTPFEVATFREEGVYSDGRHPDEVRFADARADASRRDFTVNGLFYDPAAEQVLDFVDGLADLDGGVLRAIGDPDARFGEDRLRMLRAVRFAAQLGFTIEPLTWEALCRGAAALGAVSAERIRDELLKLLLSPRPHEGMQRLADSGLLTRFLPEAVAMIGCTQPPEFHPEGDVWTHTLLMLEMMAARAAEMDEPVVAELAWSVLLHDVAKPPTRRVADRIRFDRHDSLGRVMAEDILRRLRCSRETIRVVCDLVGQHMRFMNIEDMRPARRERWLRDPAFSLHLELHTLDCLASHGSMKKVDVTRRFINELLPLPPERLITGRDLIDLGVPPGPELGRMLESIDDRVAAGELTSRDQALAAAAVLAAGYDPPARGSGG
jgi:poly(A) polymerase